jgi:hypothetical protein
MPARRAPFTLAPSNGETFMEYAGLLYTDGMAVVTILLPTLLIALALFTGDLGGRKSKG